MARGWDDEPVKERELAASCGTGKTFRGPNTLRELTAVHHWLRQLAAQLAERLEHERCAPLGGEG
eukprot:3781474-Pyramimonas_sp.AAC.1